MNEMGFNPNTLIDFVNGNTGSLKNTGGRTNILIMGIGGGNHAGADLTDTMIIVSIWSTRDHMSFISVPRDIWSDMLQDKINTAYHYGEEKKQGGGMVLSKVAVEEVTGLPIHYGLIIDFAQFTRLIDAIGGVDVSVSAGFTDDQYPIEGKENDGCNGDPFYLCRYKSVTFTSGVEHMDGNRALMYVRSRHAEGSQGNDFSRNRRQQEILLALKNTMMRPRWDWISPKYIKKLTQIFQTSIRTDLHTSEMLIVLRRYAQIKEKDIRRIQIDALFIQAPESEYGGRYALVPRTTLADVEEFIATSDSELK